MADRDSIIDHVAIIRLTEGVLTSAEAITDRVKTLDAIHLASALTAGADTVVVSHDTTLTKAAESWGSPPSTRSFRNPWQACDRRFNV